MNRAADGIRRAVDVVAAVFGLLLAAPITVAAALAIRLRLGSPVVFRQQRLGRGGAPFTLLKFRSMAHPAPGREGPEFDQERLGRLGRLLRASSIDELPSLWNLLRGEISLVGPRPLPVHYWPRPDCRPQRGRLARAPGPRCGIRRAALAVARSHHRAAHVPGGAAPFGGRSRRGRDDARTAATDTADTADGSVPVTHRGREVE